MTTNANSMKLFLMVALFGLLGMAVAQVGAHWGGTTSGSTGLITVNAIPSIVLTTASGAINLGQPINYTVSIPAKAGFGPFPVNFTYNGTVLSSKTINGTDGNSISFSYTPTAPGLLTFGVNAVDLGATVPYAFGATNAVSVRVLMTHAVSNATVTLPSNVPVSFNYTNANVLFTVMSPNSTTANVLIANVTGVYSTTPTSGSSTFSKYLVLNFTVTNSTTAGALTGAAFTVTMRIPCGSNTAPYKLIGGVWTALAYTSDTSACTITFTIPADPVVGLFSSTSTGGGGGGGGVISGGGAGGSELPTVTAYTKGNQTGYLIANFSQMNSEAFSIGSAGFLVVENFITPTSAGITFNGNAITLSLYAPVRLQSTDGNAYYARLEDISYLPIRQTVSLRVYKQSPQVINPPTTTTIVTTVPTTTVPATTIVPVTTTVPAVISPNPVSKAGTPEAYEVAAGIVVIAIAGIAAVILFKRRAAAKAAAEEAAREAEAAKAHRTRKRR